VTELLYAIEDFDRSNVVVSDNGSATHVSASALKIKFVFAR